MILLVDSKLMAYNVSYNKERPMSDMLTDLKVIGESLAKSYGEPISRVIMGFDYGKSSFRKGLYEHYKGGRNYSLMPEDFQSNYRNMLPKLAKALGIGVMGVEGVECDDLIGIMIEMQQTTEMIILVTGDRDWLQLTIGRDNVVMFDPKQHQFITTECQSIPQFLVEKSMKGDTSDNIYGVHMCGKMAFKKFSDATFQNEKSFTGSYDDQITFLYEEYMSFCNGSKKFRVHDKYKAIGVTDFHDLFHFNMALGGIFKDTAHMTQGQVALFKESLNGLRDTSATSATQARDISIEMAGNRVTMFNDPFEMPKNIIDYFLEISND